MENIVNYLTQDTTKLVYSEQLEKRLTPWIISFIKTTQYKTTTEIAESVMDKYIDKTIYKSNKGYLYVLHNDMFNYHGQNVYKLGRAKDVKKRLRGYTTAYINEAKIISKSAQLFNSRVAENLLFYKLKNSRLESNREFFQQHIDIINKAIKEVELELNTDNYKMTVKNNPYLTKLFSVNKSLIKRIFMSLFDSSKIASELNSANIKNNINTMTIQKVQQRKKKLKPFASFTIDELLEQKDITDTEFNNFLKTNNFYKLNKSEQLSIERYIYKKYWNVDKLDKEFLEKYYGKMHILFNIKHLLNTKDKKIVLFDDYKIEFNETQKEKMDMIIEVIKVLGFKISDIGTAKSIDKDTFTTKIQDTFSKCKLFTNPNKSKVLLGFHKAKLTSIKSFMGFMNTIFQEWGFKIDIEYTYAHTKINKKRKTIRSPVYKLDYYKAINNYIQT